MKCLIELDKDYFFYLAHQETTDNLSGRRGLQIETKKVMLMNVTQYFKMGFNIIKYKDRVPKLCTQKIQNEHEQNKLRFQLRFIIYGLLKKKENKTKTARKTNYSNLRN